MRFEWDAAKSATNKTKHGFSFEEVAEAIRVSDLLVVLNHPVRNDQKMIVFRSLDGKICTVAVEVRGGKIRLISAHEDRKMRKTYGP